MGGSEKKHHLKTRETFRALRRLDSFMYNGDSIKDALDQAFERGAIGVFALDCIVAEPHATPSGIGKVPLTNIQSVIEMSPLNYQSEALRYILSILGEAGLHVGFWCFLGDDDFCYSVSQEYQIETPHIRQAINQQIRVLDDELKNKFDCTTLVSGWLKQEEKYQDLLPVRREMRRAIQLGIEQELLSARVVKRFQKMVDWRKEILDSLGLGSTVETTQMITDQALEELTSFAFQGFAAPKVIKRESSDNSFIFVSTFPDMGIQNLDDECIRIAAMLGMDSTEYGTIHLPGAARTAKILGEIGQSENKDFAVFRCGDPKGSPTAIKYGKKIRPST